MGAQVFGSRTRLLKLAAVALAAVPLTACGSLHPGVGATVGGTTVSLDRIDSFSASLCQFAIASGSTAPSAQSIRSDAATYLITSALAIANEKDTGFAPDEADIGSSIDQVRAAVAGKVTGEQLDDFLADVHDVFEAQQFAEYVARQQLSGDATDDDVSQTASTLMAQWAKEAKVTVDPRLGAWDGSQVSAASGSLSVAAKKSSDPTSPPCA